MKIHKRKLFWLILAIILIPTLIFTFKGKKDGLDEYVLAKVERGDLKQTVDATGKVESASETNLNFIVSGALKRIYVKAGDKVKAGQLLASISAAGPASLVGQAKAMLDQAIADLESIKAGSSDEEVKVSEAKVASAQADLQAAQEALENAKTENNSDFASYKEQAYNRASESLFLMESSLEDVDELINDVDYRHDLEYLVLSLSQADADYDKAAYDKNNFSTSLNMHSVLNGQFELVDLLNFADISLRSVSDSLSIAYDLISKAAPGNSLTQTIINAFKSDYSTDQTNIAAKIAAVQTAKANLQTGDAANQTSLQKADNDVKKAEAAMAIAQAELDLKKSGPRDFQLKQYQAKVDSAMANYNKALADLSNYFLRAPVDSVITKVNNKVGELVNSASPVISLISESNLEIKVDVPEADIAKIHAGDSAEITLDSFGNDRLFKGHVVFVDPAETIINDVVYYKVTVSFDATEADVKSGMTSNVIILTAQRKGVLFAPSRSVIEKADQRFVKYLENNQAKEKEITTGLRADDGWIEIISGLSEGEEIITYTKTAGKK